MKRISSFLLFLVLLSACVQATPAEQEEDSSAAEQPTPTVEAVAQPDWVRQGWEIVWHDEFDGETLDRSSWTFDLGAGGWGNNESQFYTDRPENVRLEDGVLIIEAREEDYLASDYTSARIKTQSLQQWTYGRIEARLKLPTGQGIWPAFWMLGEDIATSGWPQSGEIDIMENIGEPQQIYGTVHGPGYSGGNGVGTPYYYSGAPLYEEFHVYAIEWEPEQISWYLDDELFGSVTIDQVPGEWVYDHPFFIIMNVAVGGEWPGYPDETTVFPQRLTVDYVRVYEDPDLVLPEAPTDGLHVADISMTFEKVDDNWESDVVIAVVDQNGLPVEGAEITATWLGVIRGADTTAVTDAEGLSGRLHARRSPTAGEVTFCVDDIVHPSYFYNEDANALNCLFINPEETAP